MLGIVRLVREKRHVYRRAASLITQHSSRRCNSTLVDDCEVGNYEPSHIKPSSIVRTTGTELLHEPWANKGSAFSHSERDRLGLRGLLPPRATTMELQAGRFMEDYYSPREMIPPEDVKLGGVTTEMARRWMLLQQLQDRNETLFYKVLLDNFVEMAPIVYTPTVGWVCVNFHNLYRRPRGMYFSAHDKGEMASMVYNWPQDDVSAIVVTDGSRILGLGDLGLNGLGIPIGKLDLYCAAAGFHPSRVLPVVIDVGTNNAALRNDPLYLGLRHPRIVGAEYIEIIDEFVAAVMSRWPNAVLQFEDFSINHAQVLLNRYRHHHLVFNDDIQGTAATALAGLYGALRVAGAQAKDLARQRVVCVGAGSAGIGVVRMIAAGMETYGLSASAACNNFWMLDSEGLITHKRGDRLREHVRPFAQADHQFEGEKLLEVIKRVKPTILLGLSGAGRLFTPEVLAALNANCTSQRPIIFPMSNPTSKMECTSEEAIVHTEGRAIFASGSPQPDVEYNGKTYHIAQANNMQLFPGIALGAFLGQTRIITDDMLMRAAVKLPSMISMSAIEKGYVYPALKDIRDISATIATEVILAAADEGLVRGPALIALKSGKEALKRWVVKMMYLPHYNSLNFLPNKNQN
ncbi:MAG: hypothetical protein WDW36_002016 [Sanguina aurantia]